MIETVILVTSSPSLAEYWADSLALKEAIQLPTLDHDKIRLRSFNCIVLVDLAQCRIDEPGIEAVCELHRVLALSSSPSDDEGMAWLQCGAAGYAHALSTPELLQQIFHSVRAGGTWVGRSIMQQLCSRFGRKVAPAPGSHWVHKLSAREVEVVETLKQGMSNKEIARQLDISERTVKAHLTSVFQKFEVSDRLQLLLKLTSLG